jgi:hypothetical protein
MTRKDYNSIAENIRISLLGAEEVLTERRDKRRQVIITAATEMADVFRRIDVKFDRQRFLKACGLEG